eukprot:5016884-Pyramimonas_sp.AAC.1
MSTAMAIGMPNSKAHASRKAVTAVSGKRSVTRFTRWRCASGQMIPSMWCGVLVASTIVKKSA